MKRLKPRRRRNKPLPPRTRSNCRSYGAGNCYSRVHRGESTRQTGVALYDQAKQEKPAHAEPSREEKRQSIFAPPHSPPRNEVICRCNRRPPNAVLLFVAPTAPCPDAGSTSRSRRSITKTPIS